ncbi:MAG: response regulator [Candidatus Saganbacteria bacterium]|nr:response regulator [Candidatus Saganbacteria bacterium]
MDIKTRSRQPILVIDDDPGILDLFVHLLGSNGYAIDTAKNGSQAISKARKKFYPLAFIDIVMPGLNGLETFSELKKISPKTRAVMITGYAASDLIEKSLDSGAYACIDKPFQIKAILNLSKKILQKKL